MQATWNSKTGKVTVLGTHKPRTARLWYISLRIANDVAKETMTFRPRSKMLLCDLSSLVAEHMEEFERKHGELTDASWIANGR